MRIVDIPTAAPYRAEIGSGALSLLGVRVRELCPKAERVVLVSDDTVFPLYGERALELLRQEGLEAEAYVVPAGEASKNTDRLVALLNFLTERRLARSDALTALGGGMIGDLTGFAAAVYMRGIAYFQLPTTLLAAIDSSVGGKTAVDLSAGKNLMGAFWQPRAVLCDTDLLETLPVSVFDDGCAETVKTALLFDPALFGLLAGNGRDFDREAVIARCVGHKRDIVLRDEFDKGQRGLLNLGHTLGHAVEACSGYALSHGRSVAIGLSVVCRAAARAGYCDPWLPKEVMRVLRLFELPVGTPQPIETLMPVMLSDKKRAGSLVTVVVPRRVGRCELMPMDDNRLRRFMESGMMP